MKWLFLYLPVFLLGATIAIILLWILLVFSDPESGTVLIVWRFLTGFWHFLAANVPAISWNAATWGPGLGAFIIAVVFLHRWLSRWASRTGRSWSFATSFCLVSLVPVLFVISFLVPGVLVQWEMLREVKWVEYDD
jgi:hypothetical protein